MARRSRYTPPPSLPTGSSSEPEEAKPYGKRFNPQTGYIELLDEKGRFAGIYLPEKAANDPAT